LFGTPYSGFTALVGHAVSSEGGEGESSLVWVTVLAHGDMALVGDAVSVGEDAPPFDYEARPRRLPLLLRLPVEGSGRGGIGRRAGEECDEGRERRRRVTMA